MITTVGLLIATALPMLAQPVAMEREAKRPQAIARAPEKVKPPAVVHGVAKPPPAVRVAVKPQAVARLPDKPAAAVIVGTASFYGDAGGVTASGEIYDPAAFTAAVQHALRDRFGGVKSGPDYQPAYAIAEFSGRRAVLRINDVGTMKAGRMFDLSRAAMEHFGAVDRGLIDNLKIRVLPLGRHYKVGPLIGEVEEIMLAQRPPPAPSPALSAPDVQPVAAVAAAPMPLAPLPTVTFADVAPRAPAASPMIDRSNALGDCSEGH